MMNRSVSFIFSILIVSFFGCSSSSVNLSASSQIAVPKGDVSAYYIGKYKGVESVKSSLVEVGFDILAEYKVKKIGTTILFTNSSLKAMADKPKRGFASVLRVLVDDVNKQISFINPIYYGKAFMQDEYDHEVCASALLAIQKAFKGLKPSLEDKWEFEELSGYHFMPSMPYYEDFLELGEGSDLVNKASSYKKGKFKVFELELSKGRTILGYELGRRTSKFVKKIGTQNANILPWLILVEDSKAYALDAKYYIAISYPKLSMGEFMTIATVPGAVEKDLSKPFK